MNDEIFLIDKYWEFFD